MKTYLARVACLGQWALNNLKLNNNKKTVHNQQKTRVDLLLDVESGKIKGTKSKVVMTHIKRPDVTNSILSQEEMAWLKEERPAAIIMDSFAELTDQRFDHRTEGWSFCSNYSDLKHSPGFNASFHKKGLLDIERLPEQYDEFFKMVRKRFDCPLVFIHFPVTLDKREMFHHRYKAIKEAIDQIVNEHDIISIAADDGAVEPRVNAHEAIVSSPYHFSDATIKHFSDKIKKEGRIK